ncbi:MAG: CsbD family protein [Actinomycetota bacterium]|nr:CsbD family protein [Actinomycetota bacterium]
MGITDKVTGRVKQALGDLTGDSDTRAEGAMEERKGEVKDQADVAEKRASEKRAEAADLERRT